MPRARDREHGDHFAVPLSWAPSPCSARTEHRSDGLGHPRLGAGGDPAPVAQVAVILPEVLVGGEGHPTGFEKGYYVKPTVFVNVKNDMTIAREEIFGPVLSVITYGSEDEAIRIANDSKYGLHGAVLGTDLQRARRVAAQIQAGRVVINNMADDDQAPWGGFKFSGVGREYGAYGIQAFLEPKAILAPAGANRF